MIDSVETQVSQLSRWSPQNILTHQVSHLYPTTIWNLQWSPTMPDPLRLDGKLALIERLTSRGSEDIVLDSAVTMRSRADAKLSQRGPWGDTVTV